MSFSTPIVSQDASNRKITIGSLATRFGVSCESLRNWERQGLIPPSRRTPGGHRRYAMDHVEALSALIGPPSDGLVLPGVSSHLATAVA